MDLTGKSARRDGRRQWHRPGALPRAREGGRECRRRRHRCGRRQERWQTRSGPPGSKPWALPRTSPTKTPVNALADEAWRALGEVHILVNNAGVMHGTTPLAETSAADFDWVFAVNVRGAMNGIRAFVPRFIASGHESHVVNTASEHALGVPHIGAGLYNRLQARPAWPLGRTAPGSFRNTSR